MALSMQEKQHIGREVALRSLHARKKEKEVMLQEFCATMDRLLQAPEVSDQAKARLLRQLGDIDPLALQRDIGILEARLLGTTSQDLSLKAVTHKTISL